MKRRLAACCLVCTLIIILVLSGCGGQKQSPEPSVEPAADAASKPVSEPASEAVPEPEPSPAGDVAAILAKSKGIDEMYFEYVITADEGNAEGKAWIKGSKARNEMSADGQTIVSIYDVDTGEAYTYFPDQKMAIKTSFDQEMAGWFQNPADYYEDIGLDNVKIVGAETIDGHKCSVMVISNSQGEEETKMWVSEEYGIPLRVENTQQDGEEDGVGAIEYKNLKVGSVPDDVFEIPEGVEITEM